MDLSILGISSQPRLSALRWTLVVEILVLGGLLAGLSWIIVKVPGPVPMLLVAGTTAVVIWTLYPSSTVYTLAILCPFGMSYGMMGLQGIEPADGVLLVALAVATILVLEGRGRVDRFGVPFGKLLLALWIFMIGWNSVTFFLGPVNQSMMVDPVRDIWYLYRGVWRDFFVFPVVVLCLANEKSAKRALALTIGVTALMCVYAIALSWKTHDPAMGPFSSKNGLAGFLVLVLPFAAAKVLLEVNPRARLLYACVTLVMFRALWLTSSRGGFVAFVVSLAPFLILVPTKRLVQAGLAGLVAILVIVGMKGNILNRPNIQRYLTVSRFSEQHNFQWREEQWRLFMERIAKRPWLGSGSEVVEALEQEGRLPTAHNGYLGMTMRAGIPGTAAWIVILAVVGGLSLRKAFKSTNREDRGFWLGATGLVLGWATHSLVDNVLLMSEAQRTFWLVAGLALIMMSRRNDAAAATELSPRSAA